MENTTEQHILSDEIISCVCTIQDTIAELIKIENRLAVHYNLSDFSGIQNQHRISLWFLNKNDGLDEDEYIDGVRLVADWHGSYSSYANWIEDSPTYAKVYMHCGEYIGLTGRILSAMYTKVNDDKWPYVIYYNVRFEDGSRRVISNREMIYL